MGKQILGYDYHRDVKITWRIWARTGFVPGDGFYLPPVFEDGEPIHKTVDDLLLKYGTPADPATIIAHFNRELLEPEKPDLFSMLLDAVKRSQAALSKSIWPDSESINAEVVENLIQILDNTHLVQAIRKYEENKKV